MLFPRKKPLLHSIKHSLTIVLLLLFSFLKTINAQQMIVDDAGITIYRSFQIETWYGSIESWLLPATSPLPYLEISAGMSFDTEKSFKHNSWLFEGKYASDLSFSEHDNFALVAGITASPRFSVNGFYAYIPYTREILGNDSELHVNVGYIYDKTDNPENHNIIYGIRSDIRLHDYIFLLSELFTTNLDFPGFQAGLRFILLDDLLIADITYKRGFEKNVKAPGFNIGLAFTPGPVW